MVGDQGSSGPGTKRAFSGTRHFKMRWRATNSAVMYLYSEVFDLKPTSILIWLGSVGLNVAHKRPDDPKAAEHRRTPRREREFCARNGGYVLECGGAPPPFETYWVITHVWS